MKKIRVLHIVTDVEVGGVPYYIRLIMQGLDPERFEVSVATSLYSSQVDFFKHMAFAFHPVPHLQKSINPIKDVLAFAEIYRILKKNQYDVVHTHMFKASVLGRIAARWCGVPAVLFTSNGFRFNSFSEGVLKQAAYQIEKWFARYFTDVVICVCQQEKQQALAKGIVLPHKLKMVPTAIDVENRPVIDPQAREHYRRLIGREPETTVIGTMGRLVKQKDPITLVKAAGEMKKTRDNFRIVFIGDGPLRKAILRQAQRDKLSRHIVILGFCREIDTLMSLLDVFVLPSLYEGQPHALMEAMLNRVPVVATDVVGMHDLIIHNHSGILVPPADPHLLADAILNLLGNTVQKQILVENAEKHVRNNFSARTMVAQIERIYKECTAKKRSPAVFADSNDIE